MYGEMNSFFAFGALTILTAFISLGALSFRSIDASTKIFRLPAWSFALANLATVLLVVYVYVFAGASWDFGYFIGELIIIAVGAFAFIYSYLTSEE